MIDATLRPTCGWCVSSHCADAVCVCVTPCRVGWCAPRGGTDPFAPLVLA